MTISIDEWNADVAEARRRTSVIRGGAAAVTANDVSAGPSASDELALAFEELSVASEELRVQNETLALAHATIEADRERYRELFHLAPVPYLVTDEHGTIRDANGATSDMLNSPSERLVGKPMVVFTQDASRKRLRLLMAQLHCGAEKITTMLNITPRGGGVIRTRVTVASAHDETGQLVALRWLLVDHTKQLHRARSRRRRADELERLVRHRTLELEHARELRDQLVANVSHEFRTALAAIGGYSELLTIGARGQLTEPQLGDVARIHAAYEHLAAVVNDLLRYSKLTAGSDALDLSDVALDDALRGVDDMVRPQADQKSVTLCVSPPAESIIVRITVDRLRQVVLNLLGNAVKFTEPHSTVTLGWRSCAGMAVVEVQDSGPGIPVSSRDAMFQPFVRLRNSGAPGTGLGLAISRELARAMGGDITVCDRDDGQSGCRFLVRLPIRTPPST